MNYEERKREYLYGNRGPNAGKQIWQNEDVKSYFEDHLDEVIKTVAASYYLESIGVPNPQNGITSNAAESMNMALKRQTNFERKDISEAALTMYYHQRLAANQCELAFHGMGDYKLEPEYEF